MTKLISTTHAPVAYIYNAFENTPTTKTLNTLSFFRGTESTRRLNACIIDTAGKIHGVEEVDTTARSTLGPVREAPTVLEQLKLDIAVLRELTILLNREDVSNEDFLTIFSTLSPRLQEVVKYWLWHDHGSPSSFTYADDTLQADSKIVGEITAPYFSLTGRNILEQIQNSLQEKVDLLEATQTVQTLQTLRDLLANPDANNDALRRVLLQLPERAQWALHGEVYRLSPSTSKTGEHWGQRALEGNVKLLSTLSIIDAQLATAARTLEEQSQTQQRREIAHYLALFDGDLLTYHQLKEIYKSFTPEMQAAIPSDKKPAFGKGVRSDLYKTLGSHPIFDERGACTGTTFSIYAPNAKSVEVSIRFNGGDLRMIPMERKKGGVFEITTPDKVGTYYQYLITTASGAIHRKADPYAHNHQPIIKGHPVDNALEHDSVVVDTSYTWGDDAHVEARRTYADLPKPVNIYEVHAASWKKEFGHLLSWSQLGEKLATYCKDMNYTHVELFGILDHPNENSWGYQPTGFFAPNYRLGSIKEFKQMIDTLHQSGINVIIDWVPGHMATDNFGLLSMDGTPLYEGEFDAPWGVFKFNYQEVAVRNFLYSSARYWLEEMHIDGLRVDAVNNMMHRSDGTIIPDAKTFLRDFNQLIRDKHPGVITIAEDSSIMSGKTAPTTEKTFVRKADPTRLGRGLGFTYAQDLGWMQSELARWHRRAPPERHPSDCRNALNLVDPLERLVRPLSHDETSAGKGSLLSSAHGEQFQKYAQVRRLHCNMMFSPGAKLNCMGNELAQDEEWAGRFKDSVGATHKDTPQDPTKEAVDWRGLEWQTPEGEPSHARTQLFVQELNQFYIEHRALWERDKGADVKWIDASDTANNVLSWHRRSTFGDGESLVCIENNSSSYFANYEIRFPDASYDPECEKIRNRLSRLEEVFTSDDRRYGGGGVRNESIELMREGDKIVGFKVRLAPYSSIVLKEHFAV